MSELLHSKHSELRDERERENARVNSKILSRLIKHSRAVYSGYPGDVARSSRKHQRSRGKKRTAEISAARCANQSTWSRNRGRNLDGCGARRTPSRTFVSVANSETVVNHSLGVLFHVPAKDNFDCLSSKWLEFLRILLCRATRFRSFRANVARIVLFHFSPPIVVDLFCNFGSIDLIEATNENFFTVHLHFFFF